MNKKLLLILLLTPVFLILATLALIPILINKETLKNEIVSSFKVLTGLDLEIQGDAVIENLPFPHVIINSIDVHNAPGASNPFLLKAKIIDVYPDILSLISGKLKVNSININGLAVELERLKTNQMNWQAIPTTEGAAPSGHVLDASSVAIANGLIHYTDAATGEITELKDINLKLGNSFSGKNTLELQMNYAGQSCNINGSLSNLSNISSAGVTPANLNIVCGNTHLAYDGDVGFKDNNYYFAGNADFVTSDAAPWANFWLGKTDKVLQAGTSFKPLPIEAKTQITSQGNKISFPELNVSGAITTGKVFASITLPYHLDVKANLDNFDLETILASELFDPKITTESTKNPAALQDTQTNYLVASNSIINAINADGEIIVASMAYNGQDIKDTHLTFNMAGGDMSIPQFSTKLPGNSRLIFTGIGKEGYQGFAIDGQLDAAGDDFSQMLTVLKPKGFSIPAEDFKRFRIRSNLSLSTQEIRFSEIAARIENIAFVGGIITTLGERTKIESALRIGGINMDHFITLWGLQEWGTSFLQESITEKSDALMALWLKKLGFDLTVNASLEQTIINNKLRDKIDLNLKASQGKIAVNSFKTTYNGSPFSGAISLDVTGALPRLDADIAIDSVNLNDALPASFTTPVATSKERWSSKETDFHWLELLTGTFNVRAGHVKYNTLEAANVTGKSSLDNATFNLDSLTLEMFGAQAGVKGAIKGGKIPIITLAANIQGLDNNLISPYFTFLKSLSGKYNLNLQLQTNGNNQIAWVSNLNGAIGIGARNIVVHGFNLPAIVTSIAYVRTVADILNVVKHAFPGGDTLFSTVEGQWTIASGKINLSNTQLTNDLAKGTFDGEADLVNWLMQGKATFGLESLKANPVPTIGIVITGNIDTTDKALDTRSLEQYVTNKTSEKMLQDYGSH